MALSTSHVGATNGVQLLLRRSGCWTCLRGAAAARWKGGEEQMARNVEVSDYLVMVICAWLHLLNVSPASLFSLGEKKRRRRSCPSKGEMKGRRASYQPQK
ncbi:hypothetical protein WN944_013454 [Citrus x changshan-huyou]|uniref:Uncharacterized protein n=1 Tax=Citrus x changshan-huyou TaxID=2935761 RepID=A0AAP0MAA9_9ROSI